MWPPVDGYSAFLLLSPRDDDECEAGKQFYRCGSNGFRGCCSIDPCDLEDCPDRPDIPSGVFVTGIPGFGDEDGSVSTSLTTTMFTTSEETTSTTTKTLASTVTLTKSEESGVDGITSSEGPATAIGATVTEIRQISGRLTTFTTVLRETMTETKTETTKTTEETDRATHETVTTSVSHTVSAVQSSSTQTGLGGGDTVNENENTSEKDVEGNGKLSNAQIGGVAGGLVGLVILTAVLAFLFFRRRGARRTSQEHGSSNSASLMDKDVAASTIETTHGQGPFAPFRGQYASRESVVTCSSPETNHWVGRADDLAHELDNTIQPLPELPGQQRFPELPAGQETTHPTTQDVPHQPQTQAARPESIFGAGAWRTDPRATLNETVNDEGRPAYVNHWSQYR